MESITRTRLNPVPRVTKSSLSLHSASQITNSLPLSPGESYGGGLLTIGVNEQWERNSIEDREEGIFLLDL